MVNVLFVDFKKTISPEIPHFMKLHNAYKSSSPMIYVLRYSIRLID